MLLAVIVTLGAALVASLALFAKEHSSNKRKQKDIDEQSSLINNLAEQFKDELNQKDTEIAALQGQIEFQEKAKETSIPTDSILSKIPFLRRLKADEIPDFPDEYKPIRYVYSEEENSHFEIAYENLHSDEKQLSILRVRLYEQLQADPANPLLRCSCCKKPILLSGNSGIKGEIVGFRHAGEGNNFTGEHIGENYTLPKQESLEELNEAYDLFSIYSPYLEEYSKHPSFLVLPGTKRDYPGDVTFSYKDKSVAVLFVSAGHPLDFIIRRIRTAVEKGYIPIWILSPSYFASTVMSNRDISVFSKGYICTIDSDTIDMFRQTGELCVYAREYHENRYGYISLLSFINDSENEVTDILAKHKEEEEGESKVPKRKRVSSVARTETKPIISKQPKSETTGAQIPIQSSRKEHKPRVTFSAIDYWKGKRFHIKGTLYVEKINNGFGIVDLSAHRYPVLPIYDNIIISEDKTSAELILNGQIERIVNL